MCIIDLTHVGEVLVAELLKKNPCIVRRILESNNGMIENGYKVFSEINLAPVQIGKQVYSFDGMSRIDVGIIYTNQRGENICHPVELKLGTESLENCKSGIGRFTSRYRISNHDPQRIKGNMISILDREPGKPEIASPDDNNIIASPDDNNIVEIKTLDNRIPGKNIQVSSKWTLIVRTENIADTLRTKGGFFKKEIANCTVWSFESLFDGTAVNDTMKELLPADGNLYQYWGLQQPNSKQ